MVYASICCAGRSINACAARVLQQQDIHRRGERPMAKRVQISHPNPNGSATPGSRSEALDADRERYLPRGVYTYHHVYPQEAHGAEITDVDGNTYLDFAGGIGTLNVGHSHPDVVAAISRQAAKYTHTCTHVLTPEPYVELAKRLSEIAPGRQPKKTLLINSGAE